mgnify:CR=1 FL=1
MPNSRSLHLETASTADVENGTAPGKAIQLNCGSQAAMESRLRLRVVVSGYAATRVVHALQNRFLRHGMQEHKRALPAFSKLIVVFRTEFRNVVRLAYRTDSTSRIARRWVGHFGYHATS